MRPKGLQAVAGIFDEGHCAVGGDVLLEDGQFANPAIVGYSDQFVLAVTVEIAERRPHACLEIGFEGKRLGNQCPRGGIHQSHQRRARPAGVIRNGDRLRDEPVGVGRRVVCGVRFTAGCRHGGRADQIARGRSPHVGDDREHRLAVGRECDLGIQIAGAHGGSRGAAREGSRPSLLRDAARQRRRERSIGGSGIPLVLEGQRVDDLRGGRVEGAINIGRDVVIERQHQIGRHQAPLLELLKVTEPQAQLLPGPEATPHGAKRATTAADRPLRAGGEGSGWEK